MVGFGRGRRGYIEPLVVIGCRGRVYTEGEHAGHVGLRRVELPADGERSRPRVVGRRRNRRNRNEQCDKRRRNTCRDCAEQTCRETCGATRRAVHSGAPPRRLTGAPFHAVPAQTAPRVWPRSATRTHRPSRHPTAASITCVAKAPAARHTSTNPQSACSISVACHPRNVAPRRGRGKPRYHSWVVYVDLYTGVALTTAESR